MQHAYNIDFHDASARVLLISMSISISVYLCESLQLCQSLDLLLDLHLHLDLCDACAYASMMHVPTLHLASRSDACAYPPSSVSPPRLHLTHLGSLIKVCDSSVYAQPPQLCLRTKYVTVVSTPQ